MKVGIMTCHDVFNAGSSLQAYALCRVVAEHGADVEIIDYKPKYMYRLIDFMAVESPKWQKTIIHRWVYRLRLLPYRLSLLPKYFRYRWFNRKYLPLSRNTYHTLEELRKINTYDALICGSDQIWATVKNRCGEDPAFYLDFCSNAKKVAYAASFGAESISKKGALCLEENLPNFAAISVREKTGLQILKEHGFCGQHVLDPVFLLEREDWEAHCIAPNKAPDNYVLVYGYDNNVDLEVLGAKYASENGLRLVSLKPGSEYALGDPENFLWLIKNAKMVITSSFHATAFSTIFETPFTAVQTGNKALFERVSNILEQFGLQGRIWDGKCDIQKIPPVNYKQCRKIMALAREVSLGFLLGALYGSESK